MKLRTIISVVIILCTLQSYTQIYVKEPGNVGVGNNSINNTQMQINSDDMRSLYLNNISSTGTSKYGLYSYMNDAGSSNRYGIYNQTRNSTTGITLSYGVLNQTYAYGSGTGYGLKSSLTKGTGTKYGIDNYVKQETSSTKKTYGINNRIYPYGTGHAFGIHQRIYGHGNGKRYSLYLQQYGNSRSGDGYGIYNRIDHRGAHRVYGQYNYIATDANSLTNPTFGVYSVITGSGVGTRYAIYGDVNGGPGYAGYFKGDVYTTGVYMGSDANLKENVNDITNAVAVIELLSPKSYNYKDLPNHGFDPTELRFGFLAQELEAVLPNLVRDIEHPGLHQITDGTDPGEEQTELNDEGHEVPIEQTEATADDIVEGPSENIKGINYIDLIPLLVQAIKEQQVEIDNLASIPGANLTENEVYLSDRNAIYSEYLELKEDYELLKKEIEALKECTDCLFNIDRTERYKIYPNPTKSSFIVSNEANDNDFALHILNAEGKIIKSVVSPEKQVTVDTDDMTSGVYSIIIYEGSKLVSEEKLIVSH